MKRYVWPWYILWVFPKRKKKQNRYGNLVAAIILDRWWDHCQWTNDSVKICRWSLLLSKIFSGKMTDWTWASCAEPWVSSLLKDILVKGWTAAAIQWAPSCVMEVIPSINYKNYLFFLHCRSQKTLQLPGGPGEGWPSSALWHLAGAEDRKGWLLLKVVYVSGYRFGSCL